MGRKTVNATRSVRRALDDRFVVASGTEARDLGTRLARPGKGWVRAVRDALGMTTAQLARRVGVSQPVITGIEASEAAGTVKLETLARVAAGLNCRLVYALVPIEPLDISVEERRLMLAERRLREVEHSMRLEDQAVCNPAARKALLQELAAEIDTRTLWDES